MIDKIDNKELKLFTNLIDFCYNKIINLSQDQEKINNDNLLDLSVIESKAFLERISMIYKIEYLERIFGVQKIAKVKKIIDRLQQEGV